MDYISHVFRAIWNNKIFEIRKPIEKIPHFTWGQVQNTLKILHFGVKFYKWLGPGQGKHGTLPSAICLALNNTQPMILPWRFLFCHENNQF